MDRNSNDVLEPTDEATDEATDEQTDEATGNIIFVEAHRVDSQLCEGFPLMEILTSFRFSRMEIYLKHLMCFLFGSLVMIIVYIIYMLH